MTQIFLYGPPGSGKSTIGKILAGMIGCRYFDVDERIRTNAGQDIPSIMEQKGEEGFRDLESLAIRAISNENAQGDIVVALGGGALLRSENQIFCETVGKIVFISTAVDSILTRLDKNDNTRPLISGDIETKLRALIEKRKDHYAQFTFRVDNNGVNSPIEVAKEIQTALGIFQVKAMGKPYQVRVSKNSLNSLPEVLIDLGSLQSVMLIFDENTFMHFGGTTIKSIESKGFEVHYLVIPPGEQYKTLETISKFWSSFIQAGLSRKSIMVAIGGGVLSDLTGFAASTYMRGCRWLAYPTTLLSMVDASIGGKTGFDLPQGKNLVGSFYPPELVMIDPDSLLTLPLEEFRSGLAEVVKHGIIADPGLFEECSYGYEYIRSNLEMIIKKAVRVKIDVIEEDPFEQGRRASLNLGHTIGHAVEIESEFQLKHGEAISIGIIAESAYSERIGLGEPGITTKIAKVFSELGLPVNYRDNTDRNKIIGFMQNDKKKNGKAIQFALPIGIGNVKTGVVVEKLEDVL